ncbi:MAG: hypothetical protein K2G24_09610 [Muribaculaceae bacterium]|nr:hypothetical protein [Muribaculaceae bacterium]
MLTTNEGLPDNSVNDIVEDHFGFIWIATWNGLARFDGKYVTSYRHSDGVEGTLSNNMVRCLLPDPEGIWVGSDNGLDFMRYSDGRFIQAFYVRDGAEGRQQPLSGRVSRLISSGDRIFLLTVDGDLMCMERDHSPSGSDARNVFVQLARPASRRYADLAVFKGGRILALSNEGVTLLSPDGSEELYHNSIPAYFDSNMNIYCDNSRSTVTIGGGIGTVTSEYTVDGNGRLEATGTQTPYRSLMSTAVDGNIQYYGTDGNGLYIRSGDELEHFMPSNSSLPSDAIYKVSVDSRHNLWIGTYRHGLAMLSHQLNTYTVNNMASRTLSYDIVTAVVPDGDKLYLGLDGGGLEIVDTLSGERRVFNMSNSAIPGNNIVSMVKDGPIIWAAVYSVGLVAFDTRSESFTTYRANNKIEPGNKLWVLALDGQGRLWVGGSSLSVFDRQNNTFRLIAECRHAQINSIADDPSGNLWVATRDNGLLEIDKNSGEVIDRHSSSPSAGGIRMAYPRPHLVYVDSRRNLWIAFDNSRLVRLNLTDRNDMEGYDMRYGSARGNVMSVVEDAGGNLLMGTDNGLVRYSRTRNNMMSLTDERMPKIFAQNSAARSGKTVYFGTTAGLLCYPLNNPLQAMPMPPTVFTGIEILGDDGVVLPLSCTGDSVVTLEHSQNFFKVRFALPEMSSPGQIMFECRLEGLEDGWRDVSDTRWATYTNVPSGSYRMMVRHSLSDGSWSEPSVLGITVSPAWYATAGMLIIWTLTGLVVTVMLLYFWRAYAANRDRTRMVEMERDSATRLNEAKLDFYASVTHELRTPCFLISAQIEEIYDSGRQTVPVNSLVGIYRNSAKLNKLISHIIDFRKTETGHLTLNARNIDLVTLLRELSVDYEQLCRQKSLTFSFRHDQPPVFACVDADKVELIVTNLVSNAYKYTPKGGEVSLDLRDVGEAVEISVTDNGIGVMDKLQSTIFEPFVRTERGQKVSRGDGIGLSFVKELVELHRGSIRLDSQVNEGSCFTVILPKYQKESDVDDESVTRLEPSRKPELMQESLAGEISLPDRISDPTSTRSILIIDAVS